MPRALLSVYDKAGLETFAAGLVEIGYELISTGNTLAGLRSAGLPATAVAEVTGFPEILGGRVKTLHPAIHGGILAKGTGSRASTSSSPTSTRSGRRWPAPASARTKLSSRSTSAVRR